jgi:hypothetical protein
MVYIGVGGEIDGKVNPGSMNAPNISSSTAPSVTDEAASAARQGR